MHCEITKKIAPMQPNATKVNFRELIFSMSVGDVISFPIECIVSVRVAASNVGMVAQRKYKTATDRERGVVCVSRLR